MHLIWGADRSKYTPFLDELRKDLLKGHNNYPTMVLEAYRLLLNYKNDATTYSGRIKDVDSQYFATDRAVYDNNIKTPRG